MTALPIAAIAPDPCQPRRRFDRAALDELAASIASVGLLEPILVRTAPLDIDIKWIVIAGERRLRAAKLAGLTEIPAIVRDDLDERDRFVVQMVENVIRADMDPVEEARGYQRLIDEGLEPAEVAARIGVTLTAVHYRLALLRLDEPILKLVADGQMSVRDGWLMSRLSREGQHRVMRAAVAGSLPRPGDVARMVEAVHLDESQVAMFADAVLPAPVDVKATRAAGDRIAAARAAIAALMDTLDTVEVDDLMVEAGRELKRAAAKAADRIAARKVAQAMTQERIAA